NGKSFIASSLVNRIAMIDSLVSLKLVVIRFRNACLVARRYLPQRSGRSIFDYLLKEVQVKSLYLNKCAGLSFGNKHIK
ncbi:hypothetical protein, partial [Vibrio cincinnatiensis]